MKIRPWTGTFLKKTERKQQRKKSNNDINKMWLFEGELYEKKSNDHGDMKLVGVSWNFVLLSRFADTSNSNVIIDFGKLKSQANI